MPLAGRARGGAVVALGLLAACGGDGGGGPAPPPGFTDEVIRASAHFRYHAHGDDTQVCDETLSALEADFTAVTGFLALAWPAGAKIDYYKLRSTTELDAAGVCPFAGASCSARGVVYSPDLMNEHELVHAYLAHLGHPPLFVEEGVAVVLSCDPTQVASNAAAAVDAPALAAWSTDATAVPALYVAAATLVRDLLDRAGPAAFLSYYARAARGSFDEVDASFSAAFGGSLDRALAAARGRVGQGSICRDAYACGASGNLTLGTPPTPVGDHCGIPASALHLTLPGATTVALSLLGGGSAQLLACDAGGSAPAIKLGRTAGGGGGTLIVDLAAGSYAVRHAGTPVVSAARIAAIAAEASWLAPRCDAALAGAFPFDTSPNELTLAVRQGTSTWYARLSVPEPSSLFLSRAGIPEASAAAAIALCPACGDLAAAADPPCLFAPGAGEPLLFSGDTTLAVPTDAASTDFVTTAIVRVPPR